MDDNMYELKDVRKIRKPDTKENYQVNLSGTQATLQYYNAQFSDSKLCVQLNIILQSHIPHDIQNKQKKQCKKKQKRDFICS